MDDSPEITIAFEPTRPTRPITVRLRRGASLTEVYAPSKPAAMVAVSRMIDRLMQDGEHA